MRLTARQREVLAFLTRATDDGADDAEPAELVRDGRRWWFGLERTTGRVANPLLRAALIRLEGEPGGYEVYVATPDAARVLADPAYEPMVYEALRTRRPVTR